MTTIDYILLGLALIGFVVLLARSPAARIIVKQSLLHPLGTGVLLLWDDDARYENGIAGGLSGPREEPRNPVRHEQAETVPSENPR